MDWRETVVRMYRNPHVLPHIAAIQIHLRYVRESYGHLEKRSAMQLLGEGEALTDAVAACVFMMRATMRPERKKISLMMAVPCTFLPDIPYKPKTSAKMRIRIFL
jgi:hypothetical protein